ncbi:MAG TPA: MMPL family transporter [Candidatus Saccharimonadales bacterium]|nr:MMPL family transporter [Candidatus Saccharimonadales bacterium]
MLNKLGNFIVKNRWWVIGVWVILAVVITAFAPKISEVTSSDQTSFLPSKYESVQAGKIAEKAFPQSKDDTEILIVKRQDGTKLTDNDIQTVQTLATDLKAARLDRVENVMTAPQLVSKDGTAQMVQVVVKGQASGDTKDVNFTKTVRSKVQSLLTGKGLKTGLTGNIAINGDSNSSFDTATKIVTMATFALVIILPGIIFRSPVAAFAPVLAVTLVFSLAQSLIALVAKTFDFKIDNSLSILYTVVLFGIGTDYILFLLFRYREKLRTGDRGREVVAFALSRAGEAILSAALVVAAAFAALGISDFGIFKNLAPGLVICVLTMLAAVLTLIPAVISIIGPKIFWPSKAWMTPPKGTSTKKIGGVVARHPGWVAGISFVVLLAFAVGYPSLKTSYDFMSQQPQTTESAKAYKDVSKLFSAGAISPTQVLITADKPLDKSAVDAAAKKIDAIKGVTPGNGETEYSKDGKTAAVTVLLPGATDATPTLDYAENTFRPAVHRAAPAGTKAYVNGETVAFVDVRSAVSRDLAVILPAAAIIIFAILAFLLRSVLAPLYLLIACALGFTATLGGAAYLFQGVQHNPGVIFFLPIMVYIFVVAVGTDYNILTMTRLREEVRSGLKPREAADMTIEHSSATVASAGIILAGTFGSLALAGISLLAQLGFSIAFGIILSAFVIAPLLVPSVAALLGYKVWWPGHRPSVDKNRM